MSVLAPYFQKLIDRVEKEISNQGKDENGFFKPTKAVLLRHLNVLKDLHGKPLAKDMVKGAWEYVSENLPPEWLVLTPDEKAALKKLL
jgi:hypothetical protein